jgi:hypothetical protein
MSGAKTRFALCPSVTKNYNPICRLARSHHDLLAAATDGIDLDLAVDAFDPYAAHKTGAAENLHGFRRAERHGLRRLVLQHADLGDRAFAWRSRHASISSGVGNCLVQLASGGWRRQATLRRRPA